MLNLDLRPNVSGKQWIVATAISILRQITPIGHYAQSPMQKISETPKIEEIA
jgi:hypothetical protein